MAHAQQEIEREFAASDFDHTESATAALRSGERRESVVGTALWDGPEGDQAPVPFGGHFPGGISIAVNDMPAEILRPVADELLFDVQVPRMGERAYVRVSRVLAGSAMGVANRLADSLKIRRAEISIDTMLARLQREAELRRNSVW